MVCMVELDGRLAVSVQLPSTSCCVDHVIKATFKEVDLSRVNAVASFNNRELEPWATIDTFINDRSCIMI